jgi:hypothetical protein
MKKITLIVTLILSSTGITFAEEITTNIGSLRKWKAIEVRNHKSWDQEACLAYTAGDNSRLEVYAQRDQNSQQYIEPTIQVVTELGFPKFFRAEIKIDNSTNMKYHLTLANLDQGNGTQVALSSLDTRKDIIELLKAKNNAVVSFFDAKNNRVKRVKYSLSGSHKTIGSHLFSHCDLKIADLSI